MIVSAQVEQRELPTVFLGFPQVFPVRTVWTQIPIRCHRRVFATIGHGNATASFNVG